ncbi:MAG: HTH domain-containing protein, partial [archaeon]|nr:HTH domain-containing protein [archaeon]
PKGIKDKAYVVLKNTGKPLHFTQVAALIAELQEVLAKTQKQVLPQTVHNELIKDPRFVLVGRGMYALREWGYQAGTVKDVLKAVLKKHGPLTKQELMKAAKKEREVKDSTILLNLQDKNVFAKDAQGRYYIP